MTKDKISPVMQQKIREDYRQSAEKLQAAREGLKDTIAKVNVSKDAKTPPIEVEKVLDESVAMVKALERTLISQLEDHKRCKELIKEYQWKLTALCSYLKDNQGKPLEMQTVEALLHIFKP